MSTELNEAFRILENLTPVERQTELLRLRAKRRNDWRSLAKLNCPVCKKRIRVSGLEQHLEDRHGLDLYTLSEVQS